LAPSYSVGGKTVHTVGEAVQDLDTRVSTNTDVIQRHDDAIRKNAGAIQNMQTSIEQVTGNAIRYDSDAHDTVTLGGSAKVKVTNLQDGDVSEGSTDAVTGGQLWETRKQVVDLDQRVSNYEATGSARMSAKTQGAAAAATGDRSTALGGGAVASGANTVALGENAAASASNAVALGANSVANQANTVSVGAAGSERRIVNVAPGVNGTDAVNVNQMNTLRNDMNDSVNRVARAAYGGVAAAMAMPNLTPGTPGNTVVAAGAANFKGNNAVAAGVTYRSRNGSLLVHGGLAVTDNGETGVRTHVGYEF
ncbi:YadA family autotransporter adhesin, partial [Burkholderia ubonensis]|uniref:YadA family autotransporter adhesin n=1 Tax=Burkholderia ubonensis TaxID=101571 RepID=UPI001E2E5B42